MSKMTDTFTAKRSIVNASVRRSVSASPSTKATENASTVPGLGVTSRLVKQLPRSRLYIPMRKE